MRTVAQKIVDTYLAKPDPKLSLVDGWIWYAKEHLRVRFSSNRDARLFFSGVILFINQYGGSELLRRNVREEIVEKITVKKHPIKRTELLEKYFDEAELLTIYQKFDKMIAEAQERSNELEEDDPEYLREWALLSRSLNLIYHKKRVKNEENK